MSSDKQTPRGLHKGLGFLDVFCIASGAMISSGIFILPGLAYAHAGPAVIGSYALAGVLALIGIMSVAELATAMPKAGGDYYFITRSLGPLVGTVSGVLSWFALSLKTSFAIFGMAEVVHLLTGLPLLPVAAVACAAFSLLNVVGVQEAAKLEVALVAALLGLMALYFAAGVGQVAPGRYRPFMPLGLNAMLSTAGFVFVSFGGLLNAATVAEEVRNPKRNIPLGFITSVIVITAAYTVLLYVTVGVLPAGALSGSMSPLADAARITMGRAGFIAVTVAAMLAFITTANAGIMAASRYPLALSRDALLPPFFQRIHPRFGTPVRAVAVTGGIVFLSLLLDIELLVKAASTVVLTTYVLANLAVIVLRHSGLRNYRPSFKAPGYPWLPGLGIVLFLFLIADMGLATVEISLGLVGAALLVYFIYGRRRFKQEYALLHLVERITAKELASHGLESELRTIVRERDQTVLDQFDRVMHDAPILDLDGPCDRADFFERAAQAWAGVLPLSRERILELLAAREAESSTALSDFVAAPHLVLPGSSGFHMLVARCKHGVQWDADAPAVKAVFVICGGKERRNLHLKALAAIAHIVQQPDFEQEWLRVKHPDQLRDIILQSDRKRDARRA